MARERVRQRRLQSLTRSVWLVAAAAVLAAVLLIVLSPRVSADLVFPTPAPRPYAGEGKTLGPAGAAVVLEEYADLQCPACRQFALSILPLIEEEYVAPGRIRFVFNHYAFLGAESVRAAEAVECAGDEGRAWDFITTLYSNQAGENRGAFADHNLKSIASGMGLDSTKFNTCLDTRLRRSTVDDETEQGRSRGVNSTPTFFLNGQIILGVQPYAQLKQMIDAALAQVGG